MVGIADTAPKGPVATRTPGQEVHVYFEGGVADAFAVIHSPAVNDSILAGFTPFGRIPTTTCYTGSGRSDVVAGVGDNLLSSKVGNLRAVGGYLGIELSLLGLRYRPTFDSVVLDRLRLELPELFRL